MKTDIDGTDTTDEIMWATYNAVAKHGYPETTIAKIADEFPKSKSLLYYHYESKDSLLEDLIGFMLDLLRDEFEDIEEENPYDHLLGVIDQMLQDELEDEHFRFLRVIHEIRSQAPHYQPYKKKFRQSDEMILSELVSALERGIEADVFRPVNSEVEANYIFSTMYGAVERAVTLDDPEIMKSGRDHLIRYLDTQIKKY